MFLTSSVHVPLDTVFIQIIFMINIINIMS